MSQIGSELRKAFDSVGLESGITRHDTDDTYGVKFSFRAPEDYVFREPVADAGWLRRDEVLPGLDEEVLVWPSLSGKVEQVLYSGPERHSGFTKGGFVTNGAPTHWMRLPKGPPDCTP